MDVEEAYSMWRLANPGNGWTLDAFKAGWEARGPAVVNETQPFAYVCVSKAELACITSGQLTVVQILEARKAQP